MNNIKNIGDKTLKKWIEDDKYRKNLAIKADQIRREVYGDKVFVRGLIEFSNICKNSCYYCGIRAENTKVKRYRLSVDEIIQRARFGYDLGFRTFVLQGGEDIGFRDDDFIKIIKDIKDLYSDVAITLSLGVRSKESYKKLFEAGADRYLLRQETSDKDHYRALHPESMGFEQRRRALWDLKEIGFQVGGGFMVDSPYQTTEMIIKDIRFLQELNPAMIGIGPFLSSKNTPFSSFPNGSYTKTLRLISILRILFPKALIPATTALGTIRPQGREEGLKAGANVLMPNLSPKDVRGAYSLYDNKLYTGTESAEERDLLSEKIEKIGYRLAVDRGDVISYNKKTRRYD
ncbi:MAG: [FeFe] hydrogenase H-cluster radical SAM maturase HydE [Anaerococcus sp.]|nr:[FeFe] hydrogenase H-cluster radical SAM maturase HydE [Anaerococcus sp.]